MVRIDVPLAREAIVERDDLGCGENDEPDLFGTEWRELKAREAVTAGCKDYGRTILTQTPSGAANGWRQVGGAPGAQG